MKPSTLASLCAPLCALCVGSASTSSAQTLYFAGDSTLDDGNDGLLADAPRLDDWAAAMRETATELGVDLVDMRVMTRKAANEAGEAEALTWHAPGDRTHPAVKGARLYASFFLEDVQQRGLPITGLFGIGLVKCGNVKV